MSVTEKNRIKSEIRLKSEQEYIDRYDKMTVEHCRDLVARFEKSDRVELKNKKDAKIRKEANRVATELYLLFECGEWYFNKEATIQRWIERDRAIDELLENAETPEAVECLTCSQQMICSLKTHHDIEGHTDRVLFFFHCPSKKHTGRAFFDDGEEFLPKPHLCPKCGTEMTDLDKRKGMVITTTYKCPSCRHTETSTIDLTVKKEKSDPNFERDRERFCFTKEKGEAWRRDKQNWEEFAKWAGEKEERDKKEHIYKKVEKLDKLTIDQLEKRIVKVLQKDSFEKLVFGQPEIDKFVVIPFTVRDTKSSRDKRSSELKLQQLLRTNLESTNWRLMSQGVAYRLGVLSGRLKGYEGEEDLVKLVELRNKQNSVQRYKKDGTLAKEGEDGYIL